MSYNVSVFEEAGKRSRIEVIGRSVSGLRHIWRAIARINGTEL